jgi:two-component sensor histidine kinase
MSNEVDHLSPYQTDTDERLLLVETFHRTANEASSALAALHLIKAARGGCIRWRMLEAAMQRLEGFGEVNRLLSVSFGRTIDLGNALDRLAQAIASGRMIRNDGRIVLDVLPMDVDGGPARNVLLIAYELIGNAFRHVLEVHGGLVVVRLLRSGTDVILEVQDDGPGMLASSQTSGTGLGKGIVAALVRRCGGRILCTSDALGTTFRVIVPTDGKWA